MSRAKAHELATYEKRKTNLDRIETDPFIGYDSVDEALNDCKASSQVEVLARLIARENLFISGPAGSGKTTIIKRFIDLIDAEFEGRFNVAVTASTGIAATLIDGKTIHSWSGLGIYDKKYVAKSKDVNLFSAWDRIKYTDVLIIDEISMLPAYYLDNIDTLCKYVRRNNKPFGGIQVVFLGDFLQLPPVPPKSPIEGMNYDYTITSEAWKNANIQYCYMDKTHRASDKYLKYVLKSIENNKVDENVHKILNVCKNNKRDPETTYTTLFTKNRNVDQYNEQQLNLNPNPARTFLASKTIGSQKNIEALIKARNIPEKLVLKEGATVIVTNNYFDPEKDRITAANGSVGRVVSMAMFGRVKLKLNNGEFVTIQPVDYSTTKKELIENPTTKKVVEIEKIEASVRQLPLKLGYAITVHKSQGQTFDAVEVDLSDTFTAGLGYVALSRVREAKNLIINGLGPNALEVDKRSLKITTVVKKKALESRKGFIENKDNYESLLVNPLSRLIYWNEEEAGNVKKVSDQTKKSNYKRNKTATVVI